MAAGPVAAGLGNLEKWSDLKLVCGGKEFRVHKVYVCSQSPVLAAACNGDFAEAHTGVINIEEFDPAIVGYMVDYLYKKDYKIYTYREGEDPNVPLHHVRFHAQVNGIADYYDIPDLRQLALHKMKKTLMTSWGLFLSVTAKAFPDLVTKAINSTGDVNLHDALADIAARRVTDLASLHDSEIKDSMMDFTLRTLRHINADTRKSHNRLHHTILAKTSEALATRNDTQACVLGPRLHGPAHSKDVQTVLKALTRKLKDIQELVESGGQGDGERSERQGRVCGGCGAEYEHLRMRVEFVYCLKCGLVE